MPDSINYLSITRFVFQLLFYIFIGCKISSKYFYINLNLTSIPIFYRKYTLNKDKITVFEHQMITFLIMIII